MAQKRIFSCGIFSGNPELTLSGSQSERRIRFILPTWGFCDIISGIKKRVSLGWTSDDSLYVQLEDLFIWPQIHEFYFLQTNDRKLDVVKSNESYSWTTCGDVVAHSLKCKVIEVIYIDGFNWRKLILSTVGRRWIVLFTRFISLLLCYMNFKAFFVNMG